MFKRERCDLCGDCLVECQWMNITHDQATAWIKAMIEGEHTPVLDQCITCYACNEVCPRDARPFDLIAKLQEKYRTFSSEESARISEVYYVSDNKLPDVTRVERVMSVCVFDKTDAGLIQGQLYDLPRVSGNPYFCYFCWAMMSHIGSEGVHRKHALEMVNRLARTGAKEVVCFHDDCYAMLARLAPDYGIEVPFRPVHLAEYLVEYLKTHPDRVKPLNLAIAYQRPCASRHTPEKEHFIDELFKLVSVKRVERTFDRKKALCCAGIKMALGKGDPRPDQEKNVLDAKAAGAKAMVCLCPVCMHSLSAVAGEHDLPLIFIGDLARMALGEIEALK